MSAIKFHSPSNVVMGVAKMTTIRYGWQVKKLPYMEVFERFLVVTLYMVHCMAPGVV